jgi:hypothetical protein
MPYKIKNFLCSVWLLNILSHSQEFFRILSIFREILTEKRASKRDGEREKKEFYLRALPIGSNVT